MTTKPATCVVCDGRIAAGIVLCARCSKSYDRALERDSTALGLIEWAAKRARRCALASVRKGDA